jgi:hypothetical protein
MKMNTFSRSKKEWMKDQLDTMDANEHVQVLTIINNYTNQSTKTQTGVLISTEHLSDECLKEIETYIHFLIDQRKRIDDDNKTRKSYERMVQ